MARLTLSLLGPFQVTLDGQPVTDFKSNKVRALLAYLAVEADRVHRREVLAGLLWPDWPDRDALSNLRYALSDLRQVIGDRARADGTDSDLPVLLVTRDTLQFNTESNSWVDVAAFAELVEADATDPSGVERLERAVALYKGSFLEGFSIGDSLAFEEWALFTREQIARQVSSALHRLAAAYEERGEYEEAQSYAWRQLELEPWDEAAHRQLMRALALSGSRGAALAQYETCRRLLAEELGVEPGEETKRLYEQIRDGSWSTGAGRRLGESSVAAPPAVSSQGAAFELPSFLDGQAVAEVERPVLVARKRELAKLEEFLDMAVTGRGRVVFVTGEAGGGKTALIEAFARQAQESRTELIVATGNCNAYTGIGDPYLPFRQILELLTGDVEARWAAGVITREHARRLWSLVPRATEALVDFGPDLVDTFVLGGALLERATSYERSALSRGPEASPSGQAGWLVRLEELVERKTVRRGVRGPQQSALFAQYSAVLQALALQAPLVLVLDDVQWADPGSISLLFHLGRQLEGSRILIVAAYRGEEVAIGREGERHPLEPVVNELRRDFGDVTVDLGRGGRRDFVEALLDSEPNRLGDGFREMLYRQTRGHPLFTIELLRGLQERGDLVEDSEGRWIEGGDLSWETLPARVEAVIAERIGRLHSSRLAALRVACVEGEVFTAEVVSRVLGTGEGEMLSLLSGELDRRHRLIRAESIQRVDGQRLSRYRFRHILFQKYLYGTLDEVERVYLHEQVGRGLEALYGSEEEVSAMAVQLALHFERARITDKAIRYLHQAGDEAVQLSAYAEANSHLTKALSLLESVPDSVERRERELALGVSLSMARMGGIPGPDWEEAVTRARELSHELGKTSQLCRVVGEMSILHYVRAEYARARELAEQALALAQQVDDPLLIVLGHWYLGFICFGLGEPVAARAHLQRVSSFYDVGQHHRSFLLMRGSDSGLSALAYEACCLWCLGYPAQADERSREALAVAHELDHPFTLADVVSFGGCVLNQIRRNPSALRDHAEEVMQMARPMGFTSFLGTAICNYGEALAELGQVEKGIEMIHKGLVTRQSTGTRCFLSGTLAALARAQASTGRLEEAAATLADAFAFVDETDERYYEAELHRLRGELLLAQEHRARAEASFLNAVQVARRQQAKSWELRATVSLCHLWEEQGRREEARQRLEEIYGWFTEGFDARDLREARSLLEQLSS